MATKDRLIPVQTGPEYCLKCGREKYCSGWEDGHKKARDEFQLDYHTKVVILDSNIDEGRGDRGYRTYASSRTYVSGKLSIPQFTKSTSGKTFELKPHLPYHQRTLFAQREPAYYDIHYPDDLVYVCDYNARGGVTDHVWDPKTKGYDDNHFKKGDPYRGAGALIGRARVATLGTLFKGASILFKDEGGAWQPGDVGDFESYKTVRQRVEKANRKRRARYNRYMKRKTVWEHLEDAPD